MTRHGALFVTQVGTTVMLRWHADNWDSLQLVSCHIYLLVCVCVCMYNIIYINTHTCIYTVNLTDVSNYSGSFPNYFLTSNCTIHSKFLELVILNIRTRCDHNV